MRSALVLFVLTGCTAVNVAHVPTDPGRRGVFVTTGDLDRPYESLGPLQVTRRGVILFGFVDPGGFDLQSAVDEALLLEIRKAGGDGLINVKFEQTQYNLMTRILFAFPLFFIPLPAEVTFRGEVVRLTGGPGT